MPPRAATRMPVAPPPRHEAGFSPLPCPAASCPRSIATPSSGPRRRRAASHIPQGVGKHATVGQRGFRVSVAHACTERVPARGKGPSPRRRSRHAGRGRMPRTSAAKTKPGKHPSRGPRSYVQWARAQRIQPPAIIFVVFASWLHCDVHILFVSSLSCVESGRLSNGVLSNQCQISTESVSKRCRTGANLVSNHCRMSIRARTELMFSMRCRNVR